MRRPEPRFTDDVYQSQVPDPPRRVSAAREHYRESVERLRASDYQRQEAADTTDLMYAIHEGIVALTHATLALAATNGAGQHILATEES